MKKITLKVHSDDVRNLFSRMDTLQQRIQDEKGDAFYDNTRYLEDMFRALGTCTCEDFTRVYKGLEQDWIQETPGVTKEMICTKLLQTFTNLEAKGTWGKACDKESKIIALTTKTEELKKKVKSLEVSSTMLSGKTSETSSAASSKYASKRTLPEWCITKKGNFCTDPDTGKRMVWCNKRPGSGIYMPDPHDCDKWFEKKQEQDAKYKERRKKCKREHNGDGDASRKSPIKPDANKSSGALKLDGKLKSALLTQLRGHALSDKEIASVFDGALNGLSKE